MISTPDREYRGIGSDGAISDGGGILMPLDNYGFSQKFAWISDRFGVSWMVTVAP